MGVFGLGRLAGRAPRRRRRRAGSRPPRPRVRSPATASRPRRCRRRRPSRRAARPWARARRRSRQPLECLLVDAAGPADERERGLLGGQPEARGAHAADPPSPRRAPAQAPSAPVYFEAAASSRSVSSPHSPSAPAPTFFWSHLTPASGLRAPLAVDVERRRVAERVDRLLLALDRPHGRHRLRELRGAAAAPGAAAGPRGGPRSCSRAGRSRGSARSAGPSSRRRRRR